MLVKELIENALYLSVKDRYFNGLPDPKDPVLLEYLTDLNKVLVGVGKKNPAFGFSSTPNSSLKVDTDLNMSYLDLKDDPFLTIFRAEYLYSGSTFTITLQRLGVNDFFSNSDLRTIYTFPAFYNYNTFNHRLYVYPKPSVEGKLNVFGKKKIGPFTSIDDKFPDFLSDTFLLYLECFFGKYLCSQFNAPWQAQKEELLRNYGKLVDSENNVQYQQLSINDGHFSVPIRNTRVGL
ncbi:MAG: hypothetical protein CL833_05910 [Crocinitomicaceae bacterium]|nr:hypothetical protein [Crocinitomicaceae bacterium]